MKSYLLAAPITLVLACGGAGTSTVSGETSSGPSTADSGDPTGNDETTAGSATMGATAQTGDTTGTGQPDCPGGSLAPGLHSLMLEHDGLERAYDLYIPASYDGLEATPLVLNLHPLTLGGILHGIWTSESGMNEKAEQAGFLVVQPDGTGSPASWNAGADCCDPASSNGVDDVGFIKALVAEIGTMVCVDPSRVYALGMSNGAYLSHRLACEESGFVAAIGPVVGSLSTELECDLTRAVPIMQISGSEDSLASREASFEAWRDMNGCTDTAEQTYAQGDAICVTHDECDDGVEVTHCIMWGGGHCFFSDVDPQITPGCSPTTDLDSQDMLWEFLSRWSLP